jgi:hypothetical protein
VEPQDRTPKAARFGIFDVGPDPRGLDAIHDLGVGWVRLQLRMGEVRPRFETIADHGWRLWLTLYHRDRRNLDEAGSVGFDRASRGGFPPRDPARYRDLVRATVGPYADHLRRLGREPGAWLVVQIGNEVLPRDVRPPDQPQRFWHGTAEQYLTTLAAGYEAVKSIDPAIRVAVAGVASEPLELCIDPDPPAAARPIVSWLDRLLRRGRFDVADLHLYNRHDSIAAKTSWVRRRWTGPLAATEVGGPDVRTGLTYDEAAHAEDLRLRLRACVEAGLAPVFWTGLVENPHVEAHFRHMALIDPVGFRRKPAFPVYQKLLREWSTSNGR